MPDPAACTDLADIPRGHFSCILVDPPWRFAVRSEKGRGRSAEQHYATMTLDQIKAMSVREFAAPDCALVMWFTPSNLRSHALPVLDAWGFEFKTMGQWTKLTSKGRPAMGTGYIMRNAWEPFLVATVGSPKRKSRGERDVILERRREHSRKPEELHRKLQRLYPGPYLELFARCERPGWTVWGNELQKFTPDLFDEPAAA